MLKDNRRFPRAALMAQAGQLESRVQEWLDITNQRIEECEDSGMGSVAARFAARFNNLDEARRAINEARVFLYNCH